MSGLLGRMGGRARGTLARWPALYAYARLGSQITRYARRRPHEADFGVFGLFPDRTGLFLDIGANTGDSVLSFRVFNRRSPILSFEANPAHRKALDRVGRVVRDFEYRLTAVGAHSGEITLNVPYYGRLALTGEASVSSDVEEAGHWEEQYGSSGAQRSVRQVRVPMIAIDELDLTPDFVKIDVEGAEVQVIEGMRDTLARAKPVLLIEIGEKSEVTALLRDLGFDAFRFDVARRVLEPHDGGVAQNLAFVPRGTGTPPGA